MKPTISLDDLVAVMRRDGLIPRVPPKGDWNGQGFLYSCHFETEDEVTRPSMVGCILFWQICTKEFQ